MQDLQGLLAGLWRYGRCLGARLDIAEDEVLAGHGRREPGHETPHEERAAVPQALGQGGRALAAHAVGCGVRTLPACTLQGRRSGSGSGFEQSQHRNRVICSATCKVCGDIHSAGNASQLMQHPDWIHAAMGSLTYERTVAVTT